MIDATPVCDVGAEHGESPVWHPIDRRLIWVDLGAGDIHRFDPATGSDDVVTVGAPVGAAAPRSDGGLVLAIEDGFALLAAGSDEAVVVAPVDHEPGPAMRMNDGTCDVRGRFWAGSMAYDATPGHGALYRLDPDLTVTRVLAGVTISNGVECSDDGQVLYFVDTLAGGSFWDVWSEARIPGVDAFDVDGAGHLSGRRRCFDIPIQRGVPAGMTIPDGMTWTGRACSGSRCTAVERSAAMRPTARWTSSSGCRSPVRPASHSVATTSPICTSPP